MQGLVSVLTQKCATLRAIKHATEQQLAQGISTLSVDWGAWDSAGMAARAGLARMARLGIGAIAPNGRLGGLGQAAVELPCWVAMLTGHRMRCALGQVRPSVFEVRRGC